jgi:midasin (ATPase involved in ribosome maturation)
MTVRVASFCLYGHKALCHALSEQTEVADLLGRKMLRRRGSALLSFVPGVLTDAYTKGYVLILDEFDLATPRVLTCILSALDHNTIEIGGETYRRHENFRLIATLNGETVGFTTNQRNILPREVLARFRTILFDAMDEDECRIIFSKQIPKNTSIKNPDKLSGLIADLHLRISNYLSEMALKVTILRVI